MRDVSKKNKILAALKVKGSMTQGELAEAVYGDKHHTQNIYHTLKKLVDKNKIVRSKTRPAMYSINDTSTSEQEKNTEMNTKMPVEYAMKLIQDYFDKTKDDSHARFLSWEHCYKAFGENRNKKDMATVDYLALHLAFYLASWGMYRSSFLLQKDYKVHIPIVQIIQDDKYNSLRGISAENIKDKNNLDLLEEIGKRIKESYEKEKPAFDDVPNKATDTLITKILLGTLGCVPAFDRYYVHSVKKYNISTGIYDRKSVCSVAEFYTMYFAKFEELRQELSKNRIEYPPMKLMDMCFWQAFVEDEETIQDP